MTISNFRLRRELAHISVERANAERQQQELQRQIAELNAQIKQANPPTQEIIQIGETGRPMITLALSPGLQRSGGQTSVVPISPGISTALLLLKAHGDNYASYYVLLETPEGKQVLTKKGLKVLPAANGKMVPVSLPSRALGRGDYILRLFGNNPSGRVEEIDAYSFRVVVH